MQNTTGQFFLLIFNKKLYIIYLLPSFSTILDLICLRLE